MNPTPTKVSDADAILKVLRERLDNPNWTIEKFLVIGQVMDLEDGDTWISALATPGMYEWDIKGLLEHARDHLEFFIPALDPEADPEEDEDEE